MNNLEFSNQFDVLYNNIMSNQSPGLDEYEKSVFLTKAQDEIVKAYFNPKGNKFFEGFDDNEERQIDFSMLMKTVRISNFSNSQMDLRQYGSKSIELPGDVLMFVNEKLFVKKDAYSSTTQKIVIPISYSEYSRLMSKPYRRPFKRLAWRLINVGEYDYNSRKADIIAGANDVFVEYVARYVKKPRAIILADLSEFSLTIQGVTGPQECELDSALHEDIVQRAVELAKAVYTGDLGSQISLGQVSETNKGIISQGR